MDWGVYAQQVEAGSAADNAAACRRATSSLCFVYSVSALSTATGLCGGVLRGFLDSAAGPLSALAISGCAIGAVTDLPKMTP